MYSTACRALLLILAGVTIISSTPISTLNLLRLFNDKAWITDHRAVWEKYPRLGESLENKDEEYKKYADDIIRLGSPKRSALATALNGRRRRQPSPALGKAVTPYVGVGVLNDMGIFFDALRDNLEVLASLTPNERSTLLQDTPNVIQAPAAGSGSGGGSGIGRLHALRPLRPANSIRSYNRRSFIDPDGGYPGANHHDPGLLWTGLGRR